MEEGLANLAKIMELLGKITSVQTTHTEAIQALTVLGETHTLQIRAHHRMIVATAALGIEHAVDKIRFADQLRRLALDAYGDAADLPDDTRELIEQHLAQIENYGIRLGRES